MERLEQIPPVRWAMVHPRIAAWAVLSAGMVALLVYEARDVGLTAGNWISLIIATILVAGACIWIVSWEDVDEREVGEMPPGADQTTTLEVTMVEEDTPPNTVSS